jgi:hypothetical protein
LYERLASGARPADALAALTMHDQYDAFASEYAGRVKNAASDSPTLIERVRCRLLRATDTIAYARSLGLGVASRVLIDRLLSGNLSRN